MLRYKVRGYPRGPPDLPQPPPDPFRKFGFFGILFDASVEAVGSPLGIGRPPPDSPEASRGFTFFRSFHPL